MQPCVCVVIVATETLTRPATAPVARSHVLAPPPRGYTRDDSSAELGSVVPMMDVQAAPGSELRNRHRQAGLNDGDPLAPSEPELSSDDRNDTKEGNVPILFPSCFVDKFDEAAPQQQSIFTRLRVVVGQLWQRSFSQTKQRPPTAKRQAEYDKVKHQRCMFQAIVWCGYIITDETL